MIHYETLNKFAEELDVGHFCSICVVTEGVHNSDQTIGVFARNSKEPGIHRFLLRAGCNPSKSEQFSKLSMEWYMPRVTKEYTGKEAEETFCEYLKGACLLSWSKKFHRTRLVNWLPALSRKPYIDVMLLFRALNTHTPITTMEGVAGLNKILGEIPKNGVSEQLNKAYQNLFDREIRYRQGEPLAVGMTKAILDVTASAAHYAKRL